MKPLAEALAVLLFAGSAAPVFAADPIPAEDPPAATPADTPAADAGASDPLGDLQKMYDTAIASEKETGKTMVWDGDKMVPAPDNFQNPLTPDAMSAGWRPVVVGGEVVGACNGSMCTAQGLQPDLFGPPSSCTAADCYAALPPDGPKDPAKPEAPVPQDPNAGRLGPNEQGPCPPNNQNCRDSEPAPEPTPEPTPENKEAVVKNVTEAAEKSLADGDPNSGTGSPNYGGAADPGGFGPLAFAPDGSGAYNLPPGGSTGGNGIGGNGVVSQGGPAGDAGRAINCKQAGNCEAVAQSLIDFHEGLKRGRVDGPGDANAISVAQTSERLRTSGAYNEALGIQQRSASGVAAISGALADGAELDDQGASDAGGNFDGTGATRAAIPTKKCDRHIMGRVGVCPGSD